jgi:UDP-N-acetylmuramyl pentapeptide phosphotransferase/UDP-N-acetylglucosamine-1-phosphate transferase
MSGSLLLWSALSSVILTRIAMPLAFALRAVDQPNPDVRTHTRSTPLLGGLGIAGGAAIALLLEAREWDAFTIGGYAILLALGAHKDISRKDVRVPFQLAVQGVACVLVLMGEGNWTKLPAWEPVVLVLAGMMLINAVNFLDVLDGLCACVAAIVAAGFAIVTGNVAGFALSGACIGFLAWNRPRARIFMGDVGSFFIGLTLFRIAVGLSAAKPGITVDEAICLVLLGVPLIELLGTTAMRLVRSRTVWVGDNSHLSLLLLNSGRSPWMVLALFGATATLTVLMALVVRA